MVEDWMGSCWFCAALKGLSSWRTAQAHLFDFLWEVERETESCVNVWVVNGEQARVKRSRNRGKWPDACWKLETLFMFWSVVLHPIQHSCHSSTHQDFRWWPVQGYAAFSKAWKVQSYVKDFSVNSHWNHSSEFKAKTS